MPTTGRRVARRTVLLVGEGKTEWAFLRHIKSLYISRGCGVSAKIRNAHGRGPSQVVDYTIKQRKNAAYDRVAVLLDTDLEMSTTAQKRVSSKKIQIIGSTPCIEGLLLKILNEHVPDSCPDCKTRMGDLLLAPLTIPYSYQANFPRSILEERRNTIPELEALLGCLSFDD